MKYLCNLLNLFCVVFQTILCLQVWKVVMTKSKFVFFILLHMPNVWHVWCTSFFCFKGVFIICWLPFFLTHVLKAHCRSCCISPSLYSAVTWLGYLNSAVNPIIYTTFNIEFRKAFIKILHCWMVGRREALQKKTTSIEEQVRLKHLSDMCYKMKGKKKQNTGTTA